MTLTIIEPFKIKVVEAIPITTRAEREERLAAAFNNVFGLPANAVTIDLLTDSGTGAMSDNQWAAMMRGDESYAGSRSIQKFKKTIHEITGFKHIFPVHQGRAAERILAATRLKKDDIIVNNTHFDTTGANFRHAGAETRDLLTPKGHDLFSEELFKGDMDVDALEQLILKEGTAKIPFAMITVTNNAAGGQAVSMDNMRRVKKLLNQHDIPLVIDAARFAENSYLISQHEKSYSERSIRAIAQEMFSLADAATMSAKKDGMVNIGGFFGCHNDQWAEDFGNLLILTEGFRDYGGLAGRDLEAIAVGLNEALDPDYHHYRHATIKYMLNTLVKRGIPVVRPAGGHAVFLDAAAFCPHLKPSEFPGIGLANAIYLEGGVRGVEIGSAMFGRPGPDGQEIPAPHELVRLAFPRRVYTQSHFDYVIEVLDNVWRERKSIRPYRITQQAPTLRHFTAHFTPFT
jgi:tyrosine phenol-lyase